MSDLATVDEITDMVRHWLETKPNTYYGSDYGIDLSDLIQNPMSGNSADLVIQKMKKDIPVLSLIPNAVNIYIKEKLDRPYDAKTLMIEVLGSVIDLKIPLRSNQ